ncbi:MAG: His-Xaa-Ser system protein HxsD [Clostridiales bacterium]|jgi:His-Xaa-Ser system protein HxsD|nr:His-Xaa-Ser system protein HxsD [Clostridiales bacterium]
MRLVFNKSTYPQEALIKSAYYFVADYYLEIEHDDNNFYVEINAKKNRNGVDYNILAKEFKNELLANTIRYIVSQKTRTVRELVLARALASTVLDNGIDNQINSENQDEEFNIDEILTDWFEGKETN